jgi:hypothetical protein
MAEAIENIVYDYLSINHGGWEIDDGSYGQFVFLVQDDLLSIVVHARYLAVTSSYDKI